MPTSDTHARRIALSVTTVGILAATLNSSILLISLPAIFRGLGLDPLAPSNISYLLWMLMGFMLVTAVLVVTFGRLGDQYGRAKIFNLGFLIFTIGSIGCALVPNSGGTGALEIIILRIIQGVGGAMVMANSTAIITDAFPAERRGFALGVNQVAAIAGSFFGLIIGGILSEWDWRAVFWVSVPIGAWGTWMGYRTLHDPVRDRSKRVTIDWWGNLTFGVGLISALVAVTYGLQPYGGHPMGWTSPKVLAGLIGGVVLLVAFVIIETKVSDPMIDMRLFRIRAFSAGQAVNLLAAMSRGGLQFMLIIWLQGIWLPLHGYDFADTPLWAGIYMLPLTLGFLVAGPASGAVSDRFGARAFATGGLLLTACTFGGLILLPANFNYVLFAVLLAFNGIGMGLMAAPNSAAIMNAVPSTSRGAASGIRATGMNAGMVISLGGFFTLMAVGLASRLPAALQGGLTGAGVDNATATQASHASPVGILFAAFLGGNPIKELVPHASPAVGAKIYDGHFFPGLISGPFMHGLTIAFTASIVMLLIAAGASLMRGEKFVHTDADGSAHHDTPLEALAREGDALASPAVPAEEVAYDDAVSGRLEKTARPG
ncbi:MFS transporter [uncultured Jatrophihabitans sp.]|uniref:MFS transporter n=1 Tax=uncultured Jatrophihabitans sp. TaxID=1610747 RepID=UPI0035C94B29